MIQKKILLTKQQQDFLLGYPKITDSDLKTRYQELAQFQLESFYTFGNQQLKNIQIVGLGYVGLVILVSKENCNYALKVRRTNILKSDLLTETKYLKLANSYGIAPTFIQGSQNFLLMEYIEGQPFLQWLELAIAQPNFLVIETVLENLLEQAFQLDQIGLDRGDMNCITNDVMITPQQQPVLIDFSSASGDRQPKNLTSLVQGLFWGSVIAEHLRPIFPHCHQANLLPLLRAYKQEKTYANFFQLKQRILCLRVVQRKKS